MKISLGILVLLVGLLGGCSTLLPVPEATDVGVKEAEAAWGRVLHRFVDAEGRIDFHGVAAHQADLNTYVRFVSKTKLENFPTPNDRLAFYLNAYNALSMYGVIVTGFPEDFDGFFRRLRFFYLKKYVILGEEKSLYTFENEVIRKLEEPRVHVALNCMSTGCPRLPREPFTGAKLEAQLEREARKFFNEARNVRTENAEKTVHISEILDFFTEDFLKKAPTLIDYVNKYHAAKIPTDYKVKFIPYDWRVYYQPSTKKEAK